MQDKNRISRIVVQCRTKWMTMNRNHVQIHNKTRSSEDFIFQIIVMNLDEYLTNLS